MESQPMRTFCFVIAILCGTAALSPPARAIGCLSGGAAGALAGHMAGHGVLGAIGGCIAGHQWHKHQKQLREQDLQNQEAYDARRRSIDPNYKSPWESAAAPGGTPPTGASGSGH
jgi:hypothetical protein